MSGSTIGRRGVLALGLAAGAVVAGSAPATAAVKSRERSGAQSGDRSGDTGGIVPIPVPEQAPAVEGRVSFGSGELWYWDTGGTGEPVVLMHAGSTAGTVWGYQQPVFAAAGYRVIGYSRRGYANSDAGDTTATGSAVADLNTLADQLGLSTFHLVGTAAGSILSAAYTITHPDRIASLALTCSLITNGDADYVTRSNALRPEGWSDLPVTFQELGPSYRAADPDGAAAWAAHATGSSVRQSDITVTAAALAALSTPILLATGDGDLYTPPAMLREIAAKIPKARMVIFDESGHSGFWERPQIFNDTVLGFLSGCRKKASR
ncbi:alpha/beta hydrolase [Actinoplanes sp. NPDC051851]|uniref:alpha/beta fold hydrolase n=1 Tax=Actinoplanes sp. NPDC051851 TaxID=3154753 RepID=UPI0034319BAA